MGDEPFWLTFEDVDRIHSIQLELYGGLSGVKDENLIHSALAAPRHHWLYGSSDDLLVLAIRLCFAIAKNHGFLDGNKRTAAVAMIAFLAINGHDLFVPDDDPDEPLLGLWIERLVTGAYSEAQLYDRLEHFLQPAAWI